jgi:two-component system, OmpR family, phosphate regulon sensor histidine kinase PhoR
VQSWLELTQMEANPNIPLQAKAVELRSLITTVWETLEPLAGRQHLSFSYSGPENLWIKADKARIYQVFLNLLDNSIKYSPPSTSIHIEAKILSTKDHDPASPILEINLIDAGVGFSEADLPHVFERFYRGDKARTHSPQDGNSIGAIVGNGLGLAIVEQILIAHGGSIKAMNHPETGGAWMQLQFREVMANSLSQDYS